MTEATTLDGLADLPPGPELGALLARVTLPDVPNDQIIDVLVAEHRQLAHQQARMWAVLDEVARCDPDARTDPTLPRRVAAPDPYAVHEIAAALTWTANAAFAEHHLAEDALHRLPEIHAALLAGRIDRPKVRVFCDLTIEVAPPITARICADLLPLAPGLTTGQLRARILRMLAQLDPAALARRYRRAVRERTISGYLAKDGTATITATGLPPQDAAASTENVEHLAGVLHRAGHPGKIGQIRVDLFLALLDGSLQGLTNAQIIQEMLTRVAAAAAATDAEEAGAVGKEPEASGEEPEAGGEEPGAEEPGAAGEPGADQPGIDQPHPDQPGAEKPPAAGEPGAGVPEAGEPGSGEPGSGEPGAAGPGRGVVPAAAGIEIRVPLSTLLGLDEAPGEIPGWGPVLPGSARAAVARQQHAEWRFAICDAEGYLVLAGVTRRRPWRPPLDASGREVPQRHGGVVELQVPATLLTDLTGPAAAAVGPWAPVIADLAAQYARRHQLLAALDQRPDDRFPHTALRRHLEIRDRTCTHPGCRWPALKADQDHTLDHTIGGRTVETNLGARCHRHHRLKHDTGWQVSQPAPGHFHYRSPLGRTYHTRGEPIIPPPPAPIPPEELPPAEPDDEPTPWPLLERLAHGPILPRPPPQTPPPEPTPTDPDDDEPPF